MGTLFGKCFLGIRNEEKLKEGCGKEARDGMMGLNLYSPL